MPQTCPTCGLVYPDSTRICDCGYFFAQRQSIRLPKRTPAISWLFCSGILLLGLLGISLGVFGTLYGTTPEDELTLAEGVPDDVSVSYVTGRYGHRHYTLRFTVGGYRTEYGSASPHYEDVLAAVGSGDSIQVGVSTKRETVFARQGWVPLYKLSVAGRPVLSYSEVVGDSSNSSTNVLLGSGFLLWVGMVGLFFCKRGSRQVSAASDRD